MLDLVEEFRSIVAALEVAGVPFAVCGGLAVAIHSRPRATVDVDLLLPRSQIDSCKDVVRELGYTIEAGPMVIRPEVIEMHRMSKADEESGDLLSVDLLVVTRELEPVWAGRENVGWEYGELPVVSRTGLIQMKRLRGNGQDQEDIRSLEEGGDGPS
ncbi:MAG: nucleotidyltransferase family protein [bacterium]|nr:nucleotidyltransferase family protein [bacterium]